MMMKNLLKLHLLLFVLLFASCAKDDHVVELEPETPDETGQLQTEIVGKWLVSATSGRTNADNTFLEFMADSTYIISGITEKIVIGKYLSSSENSAKLGGFGEITGVVIAQGKINCTVTSSAGRKITITAAKAAEIATDDRTKLLARNWALTSEEDGGAYLTSDSDPNVKFDMDFIFSAAGTYLTVVKFQGLVEPNLSGNWKWHSTDKNRIVLYQDGETINEEENFLIRSVTANTLKLTGKNDIGDVNWTFKPSK